ncbi:3-oxoacyl-[acyl-carrier protein] reductase [Neorhizobium galegae]|uniref:SDR family oxidoreductase n=1 Tax=Neorhizobium galegae TaxID=399 RepID=UPI001AE7D50C|nr:SDR family oxidoreductase [Neorhizobium galegae]MBP2562513.1 3-oxoacyl-[acyl-carrier protein] reductase [Neorhizobium galegae]
MKGVAIITGGTGTIGAAISELFQKRGATVVVADLDEQPVAKGQTFIRCDVTDPKSVASMFAEAAKLGDITSLVVAHGILLETVPGTADPVAVGKVLDVNLKGSALVCDQASAHLAEGASILLLSSMSAFMGRVVGGYAYQASKAGIESMTRSYAVAFGARGIRVNCIAPGYMAQPMKGEGSKLRARQGGSDKVREATPLRRLVTEQELAMSAAFLCSDQAPSITGVVLPVDSGQRAF